jgi:CubicO group peptidase (beta-lactamase class C family)
LNRINTSDLPPETYFAAGAGGQNTWIVPSHDLVIVRMGHMRGQGPARRATNAALRLVMEAVSPTHEYHVAALLSRRAPRERHFLAAYLSAPRKCRDT